MAEDISTKVNSFLEGYNPMERVVNIECGYDDDEAYIIYNRLDGKKMIRKMDFKPFVWAKNSVCIRMFHGDRKLLVETMNKYNIKVKKLKFRKNEEEESDDRLEHGYKFLFYATKKMSWSRFQQFFQSADTPIYPRRKKNDTSFNNDSKEFLAVAPNEQFMMSSGIRLFKGYNGYDELKRLLFDLETTGLNAPKDHIDQIGIRTNKGFEKVISVKGDTLEEKKENEHKAIDEFLKILHDEKPDIIAGHNSENFDFNFMMINAEDYGESFSDMSLKYFANPIYKKNKESVLKLGGEVEYFKPTIMWGTTILDSMHAVRRAQATDSDIKSANLKYVTQYLGLKKENRVYVKGDKIGEIWRETKPVYAFNNTNGDYYLVSDKKPLQANYELKTGEYIVERYLLDDIWETDKVELALNEANFLISKILPTSFQRASTMGTAGIWKLIMLAWCYENDLAIPSFTPSHSFTGGLSRLLKTGYADNVAKLDYNSLYPSIMLTWWVESNVDISNAILNMLNYVLTNREKYKGLKNAAGKKADSLKQYLEENKDKLSEKDIKEIKNDIKNQKAIKSANDKKQNPLKVLGNSVFGSFGSPQLFPFGDQNAAEFVTCTGRQCLRLMIHHFKELGYEPIVGDTDGFNFQLPKTFRYTEEHPYISNGAGRNYPKGKTYIGCQADVAEFENTYLSTAYGNGVQKMGLDIDEIIPASINLSRKNYIDVLEGGKIKLVGNTIKSRRLSSFIEKFFDKSIPILAHGKGYEFLNLYYDYLEKIYNYQIPLKDIASKGKIKKTLEEYKKDCNTLTKAGSKKSRQVWYELAIQHNLKVDLNDTVYYVNTASSKSQSNDAKKILHQYTKIDGEEVELKGKIKTDILKKWCEKNNFDYKTLKTAKAKEILKPHVSREWEEIIINCKMIPLEIAESEDDLLCSDVGEDFEYNVEKYIEMFNKRITALLVCFHPNIREKILITKPSDKPTFTEKECELVSGYPMKEGDEDTYEALMTPERKEIEFWVKNKKVPPFVKECDIDWDKIVSDYFEILEKERDIIFQEEDKKYKTALASLTTAELLEFDEDYTIPKSISEIVTLNSDMHFYFKKLPEMRPSTGGYIFEDLSLVDKSEEEFEKLNSYVNEN